MAAALPFIPFQGETIPRLPPHIQHQVLCYLWDDPHTLAKCRLVSKGWNHLCVQRIPGFLHVSHWHCDRSPFGTYIASDSPAPWVSGLRLVASIADESDTDAPLFPSILATRFPNLSTLVLEVAPFFNNHNRITRGILRPFPITSPAVTHFAHCHHVTFFALSDFHFSAFSDLRQVVGAFPALTYLEVARVTWDPDAPTQDNVEPLQGSTGWRISYASIRSCSSNFSAVAFWVASSTEAAKKANAISPNARAIRPALTADDAIALIGLIGLRATTQYLSNPSETEPEEVTYWWSQDTETTWTMRCTSTESSVPFISFAIKSNPHILTHLGFGSIHSVETDFKYTDFEDVQQFDWENLDAILSGLPGLEEVELELTLCTSFPYGIEPDPTRVGDQVEQHIKGRMPRSRQALRLRFGSEMEVLEMTETRAGNRDIFEG